MAELLEITTIQTQRLSGRRTRHVRQAFRIGMQNGKPWRVQRWVMRYRSYRSLCLTIFARHQFSVH